MFLHSNGEFGMSTPVFNSKYQPTVNVLLVILALLWGIYLIDLMMPFFPLSYVLGMVPHTTSGLIGIVTMHFAHANLNHIISNSLALVFMGGIISVTRGSKYFINLSILLGLSVGVVVWLLAPANTIVMGYSGIIFGYGGFLLAAAIFERSPSSILIALIVFMFFGTSLSGIFPINPAISWQAHLSGFIIGICYASLLKKQKVKHYG